MSHSTIRNDIRRVNKAYAEYTIRTLLIKLPLDKYVPYRCH